MSTKSFRLSKTSSRKHDGVGQQALGAISCMVLARLEPDAYCYVNDPARPAGASHPGGVEAKAAVYATAHAPYPKLRATLADPRTYGFSVMSLNLPSCNHNLAMLSICSKICLTSKALAPAGRNCSRTFQKDSKELER